MNTAKKRILHERIKEIAPDLLEFIRPFGKVAAMHGKLADGTQFEIGEMLPEKNVWDGKARPTYKRVYTGSGGKWDGLTEGAGLIGPERK